MCKNDLVMKHIPDIQDLLNRYWEGETTLEEERQLKSFFSSGAIPEQYRKEAALFRALQQEQQVEMPAAPKGAVLPAHRFGWYRIAAAASFLVLLTAGAWWWLTKPDPAPQPALVQQQTVEIQTPAPVRSPAKADSGKDLPLAVAQVKPKVRHRKTPKVVPPTEDTFDDPEQALAEIRAALALVSSKINRSKHVIDKGLQEVDNVDILLKKKKETNG